MEFTHCRLFAAQSSVTFGPPSEVLPAGEGSRPDLARKLPPGLTVALKVTVHGTLAVGVPVEGTVDGNVSWKKAVLIPDGSPVRGRVREVSEDGKGGYQVALEFTDVDCGGRRYRFFADLMAVDGVRAGTSRELPGVGAFAVEGPALKLPAGLRMVWKTRSLAP